MGPGADSSRITMRSSSRHPFLGSDRQARGSASDLGEARHSLECNEAATR